MWHGPSASFNRIRVHRRLSWFTGLQSGFAAGNMKWSHLLQSVEECPEDDKTAFICYGSHTSLRLIRNLLQLEYNLRYARVRANTIVPTSPALSKQIEETSWRRALMRMSRGLRASEPVVSRSPKLSHEKIAIVAQRRQEISLWCPAQEIVPMSTEAPFKSCNLEKDCTCQNLVCRMQFIGHAAHITSLTILSRIIPAEVICLLLLQK